MTYYSKVPRCLFSSEPESGESDVEDNKTIKRTRSFSVGKPVSKDGKTLAHGLHPPKFDR